MRKGFNKGFIVFNLIMNIPMALAMSLTAPILMKMDIFNLQTLRNIILGFILATLINVVFPIEKISSSFAAKCKLKPNTPQAGIVGNFPVCLLFVIIIGAVITLLNVPKFPDVIFAFFIPFIPLYIVCFIVSLIFYPIASKAAEKLS